MASLDPRLIKVTINIDGKDYFFDQRLMIKATGTKYANPLQDEAEVTIFNLAKNTQDLILTKTSPYTLDDTQQTLIIQAGRQSYGLAEIYRGNIVLSSVSQPPDIGITMKCLTGNLRKQNIITINAGKEVTLERLANQIAQQAQLQLDFQATNKNIINAAYSGDAAQITGYLNSLGGVNVFINGNILILKDAFVPLRGTLKVVSPSTGMIGIPEFTEQGLKVKFLLDNKTTIGGELDVQSKIYQAATGRYAIYKLSFEIASRDTPFYYIAECARIRGSTV
jgi:filamentous hemagglutinin family protein